MFRDFYRQRIRPKGYLAHLVRERTGCSVTSGPFAGMRYIDASFGSAYIPKLLGTYEQELSNVLAGIIAKRPKAVVDVGAAEGYYAVGLARAFLMRRLLRLRRRRRAERSSARWSTLTSRPIPSLLFSSRRERPTTFRSLLSTHGCCHDGIWRRSSMNVDRRPCVGCIAFHCCPTVQTDTS